MNYTVLIPGIAAAALFCSCGNQAARNATATPPPQPYPTEVLDTVSVTLQKTYPVILRGQEDVQISPRVDGFIEKVWIDEGSVVKKGQLLFTINSPQSVQALETAKASVNSFQAQLNTAKLNVDRMQPLADKKIISNVQLQTYQNQHESARAALDQANATLAQAQAAVGWTRVTSPVDGIAGEIPYRQGSLVNSANVLTTIANTGNVFAYFSLNEKDLMVLLSDFPGATQKEKIANMPSVRLLLADGSEYPETGHIETISGVVNSSTGSANLRAEFPNPSGTLRSGTTGRVIIPRVVRDVFRIPQKATFAQQDKTLVYKVQGDSVVQAMITVESMPDGQHYAVTSGLQPGDRIVTDGVATLSNGKKIKVQ